MPNFEELGPSEIQRTPKFENSRFGSSQFISDTGFRHILKAVYHLTTGLGDLRDVVISSFAYEKTLANRVCCFDTLPGVCPAVSLRQIIKS